MEPTSEPSHEPTPIPTHEPTPAPPTPNPNPEALTNPPQQVQTVVTTSSAIATGAGALASSGAADLQALSLISSMQNCYSTATPTRSVVVTPLTLSGETAQGYLWGSCVIVIAVFVLHITGLAIVRKLKNVSWSDASTLARFPSWTLVVLTLGYQGILYESVSILGSPLDMPSGAIITAVICTIACTIFPFIMCFVVPKRIPKFFLTRYRNVGTVMPKASRAVLLPYGFWGPVDVRSQWGAVFNSLRGMGTARLTILLPYFRAGLVSCIGVVETLSCRMKLRLMIVIFVLCIVWFAVVRPYRSRVTTIAAIVTNTLSAMVCASPMVPAFDTQVLMMIMTTVTALSMIVVLVVQVLERKWEATEVQMREKHMQELHERTAEVWDTARVEYHARPRGQLDMSPVLQLPDEELVPRNPLDESPNGRQQQQFVLPSNAYSDTFEDALPPPPVPLRSNNVTPQPQLTTPRTAGPELRIEIPVDDDPLDALLDNLISQPHTTVAPHHDAGGEPLLQLRTSNSGVPSPRSHRGSPRDAPGARQPAETPSTTLFSFADFAVL